MEQQRSINGFVLLAVIAVLTLIAFTFLIKPQQPATFSERVDNAAEEISDGVRDAGRELDPNRTPAEKVGDAVSDMGENISEMGEK